MPSQDTRKYSRLILIIVIPIVIGIGALIATSIRRLDSYEGKVWAFGVFLTSDL